ncbi:MAG: porin, partial [Dehalococcoidia bacterium]
GGLGAWEVAARYSNLDLNDASIGGGKMHNLTFGLNWYLNPNVRWMVNAVLSKTKDSVSSVGITDGNAQIYQTRVQIDW